MKQTIRIDLPSGQSISIVYSQIDLSNFQAENVMRINYANIPAEVATFPALLSKIKILIAEANRERSLSELNLKIMKSQIKKNFREEQAKLRNKVTNDQAEEYLHTHTAYKTLNKKWIQSCFEAEVLDGLYWAMNSKDQKLNTIVRSMDSNDLEDAMDDLEGEEFNGVYIEKLRK